MMDPSGTPVNSTPTTPRNGSPSTSPTKKNLEAVPIVLDELLVAAAANGGEGGGGGTGESLLPAEPSMTQISLDDVDGVRDPGDSAPAEPTEPSPDSPTAAEAEAKAAAEFGGVDDAGVVAEGSGGAEDGKDASGKTLAERLKELSVAQAISNRVVAPISKTTVAVAQAGWDTGTASWDKWAEVTNVGLPKYEQIEKDVLNVHDKFKNDGVVSAAKVATTTYIAHATTVTGNSITKTKDMATGTKDWVKDTTTSVASSVASKTVAISKPLVERVLENPSVEKVVGGVTSASVGVGSMVTTVTKQTKDQIEVLKGNTPEAAAAAALEADAWRQVLEGDGVGGNRGEELLVPARTTSTSAFFVKANAMLQWRFRVAAHDIGFAIRLRVQGDGGATEVDVFSLQKYASGVTVQGEWSPSTDSQLIVVWDNAYSYLREKTVAFQAAVKKPSPVAGAAAASAAAAAPDEEPTPAPAPVQAPEPTPPGAGGGGGAAGGASSATRDSVLARLEAMKKGKQKDETPPDATAVAPLAEKSTSLPSAGAAEAEPEPAAPTGGVRGEIAEATADEPPVEPEEDPSSEGPVEPEE